MKKNFKYYVLIWVIFLVMYNAIVFALQMIPGSVINYDVLFWPSWVCVMAAFAGQLICANIVFKEKNAGKLFLNLPLITESYVALCTMAVVGGILMLIPGCPVWLAAVVCILVLGFSAVSIVKAKAAAEIIGAVDDKVKMQTVFIKFLTADAENLLAQTSAEEIRTEVKKIYEMIRYSDPMSNPALAESETQINMKFDEFSKAVKESDISVVREKAKEVTFLLNDRNRKCKMLK